MTVWQYVLCIVTGFLKLFILQRFSQKLFFKDLYPSLPFILRRNFGCLYTILQRELIFSNLVIAFMFESAILFGMKCDLDVSQISVSYTVLKFAQYFPFKWALNFVISRTDLCLLLQMWHHYCICIYWCVLFWNSLWLQCESLTKTSVCIV